MACAGAGAEVVDGDSDALLAQLGADSACPVTVVEEEFLGDLHCQEEVAVGQGIGGQARGGEVHLDVPVPAPRCGTIRW